MNSIEIANRFNKRHDHMLKKIRDIKQYANEHFTEIEVKEGRITKAYDMTQEGVLLIIGSFTGSEYIENKLDLFKEIL